MHVKSQSLHEVLGDENMRYIRSTTKSIRELLEFSVHRYCAVVEIFASVLSGRISGGSFDLRWTSVLQPDDIGTAGEQLSTTSWSDMIIRSSK